MTRSLPQLASFALALITAYAGLATAGPRPHAGAEVPQVGHALADPEEGAEFDEPIVPPRTTPPAEETWPERIAQRLADVARRANSRTWTAEADGHAALRRKLAELVRKGGPGIAVHVADLDAGTWLFDQNGAARLNPASNQKVLTAIAALELLGPDYRFETRLVRDGDALVLIGDGDPSLQLQGLHTLASRALAAGATEGVRRIVIDERAFSPERFGPGYEEPPGEGPSYLAPSGALSLSFNTVEATIRATGEDVAVSVVPASGHVAVVSQARAGRGGPLQVTSACTGETTTLSVRGKAPRRPVTVRRRICDPGRFTGEAFAAVLHELGGPRLPVEVGAASAHAQEVATLTSPPLSQILASALKYSNNFTSEQVLRTLGRRMSGEPGSWENGRAALEAFWRAAGNDPRELALENGSGLSRRGRVSARGLVRVLALARDEGAAAAAIVPALAAAGGEGTLRLRMPAGQGRVRGKTGTIGGVSALSGIAATPDGRRALGFSVLMNGKHLALPRSRRLQDRIVLTLLGHLDAG
ncbi:MAG TPA: D-alanyl-D-alanine carboxypeptidase/D-alanyl-D-alanine-endopeptidase [Nannocystis sp.]